jgi:hypothetical protein
METIEVLYEYDSEPLSHILQDSNGDKYYAHALIKNFNFYATVKVTDTEINKLKNNEIDIVSLFNDNRKIEIIDYYLRITFKVDYDSIKDSLP